MLHNAGAGIKKEIPDVPVLMYTCSMGWNLAPDEGGYAIYNHLPDRLFLRNKQGKYCTFGKGWKVFDLSQPEMFQRWLAMAQTAKDSGVIDGLFVDSGNLDFHFCDVGNTSKLPKLDNSSTTGLVMCRKHGHVMSAPAPTFQLSRMDSALLLGPRRSRYILSFHWLLVLADPFLLRGTLSLLFAEFALASLPLALTPGIRLLCAVSPVLPNYLSRTDDSLALRAESSLRDDSCAPGKRQRGREAERIERAQHRRNSHRAREDPNSIAIVRFGNPIALCA